MNKSVPIRIHGAGKNRRYLIHQVFNNDFIYISELKLTNLLLIQNLTTTYFKMRQSRARYGNRDGGDGNRNYGGPRTGGNGYNNRNGGGNGNNNRSGGGNSNRGFGYKSHIF
jgi:hypothetical protein